uniref:Uncharacterized protein n=1 Tax=Romanomermis culicivorax TaxID=13658 RepID=A0A915JTI0_ROMCU
MESIKHQGSETNKLEPGEAFSNQNHYFLFTPRSEPNILVSFGREKFLLVVADMGAVVMSGGLSNLADISKMMRLFSKTGMCFHNYNYCLENKSSAKSTEKFCSGC